MGSRPELKLNLISSFLDKSEYVPAPEDKLIMEVEVDIGDILKRRKAKTLGQITPTECMMEKSPETEKRMLDTSPCPTQPSQLPPKRQKMSRESSRTTESSQDDSQTNLPKARYRPRILRKAELKKTLFSDSSSSSPNTDSENSSPNWMPMSGSSSSGSPSPLGFTTPIMCLGRNKRMGGFVDEYIQNMLKSIESDHEDTPKEVRASPVSAPGTPKSSRLDMAMQPRKLHFSQCSE